MLIKKQFIVLFMLFLAFIIYSQDINYLVYCIEEGKSDEAKEMIKIQRIIQASKIICLVKGME